MANTSDTPTRKTAMIQWLVPLFFGLVFGAIGLWQMQANRDFLRTAYEIDVTVTAIDQRRNDDGITYRPRFAIEQGGQQIEFAGDLWVSPSPHEVGDVVPGWYDPQSGELRSEKMMRASRIMGWVFSAAGVGAILVGFVLRAYRRRRAAR